MPEWTYLTLSVNGSVRALVRWDAAQPRWKADFVDGWGKWLPTNQLLAADEPESEVTVAEVNLTQVKRLLRGWVADGRITKVPAL